MEKETLVRDSHDNAAGVLLLRVRVKHLALGAEAFALLDEVVEFFTALENLTTPLTRPSQRKE